MRSKPAPLSANADPPRWTHGRFISLRDDPAASALMVSGWFLLSLCCWQSGRIGAELGREDAVFDPLADSQIGRWLTVALLCLVSACSHRWARNRQESVGARPEHLWHSEHRPPDGRDRAPEIGLARPPWGVTGVVGSAVMSQLVRGQVEWIRILILTLAITGLVALADLWARHRIASKLPADHGVEFATDRTAAAVHCFAVLTALTTFWIAGRTGVPWSAGIGSTLSQMLLSLVLLALAGLGSLIAPIFWLRRIARRQATAAASAAAPPASAAR